jgi:hypothetical protein
MLPPSVSLGISVDISLGISLGSIVRDWGIAKNPQSFIQIKLLLRKVRFSLAQIFKILKYPNGQTEQSSEKFDWNN